MQAQSHNVSPRCGAGGRQNAKDPGRSGTSGALGLPSPPDGLRVAAEPLDFSLALLLQRQVEAAWYGVYVSVDPVTGDAEPLAHLTNGGPEALVGGELATVQARRRAAGWAGVEGAPGLAASLEAVHRAGRLLTERLGAEVDVEFAVPAAGADPVVLQCRPLTRVGRAAAAPSLRTTPALQGRPCAGGRAAGGVNLAGGVAVVEQLTPADYGIVLSHAGVVTERDASPLSHAAVLCRELGVPLVCGVAGARAALAGRSVAVDGGTGTVEIVEPVNGTAAGKPPSPPADPVLGDVELLLRVLAEGRPGHPPADEAARILQRYARALGRSHARLVAQPVEPAELAALDRMGAELFGPEFSAASFLAGLGYR